MGDYRESREDRQHRLLRAAFFQAETQLVRGHDPSEIIRDLVDQHQANYRPNFNNTHALRCRGVNATCTWSRDAGLLRYWLDNARKRLAVLAP